MILVHLLFLLISLTALIVQLVTPVVLNIPVMAVILLLFILTLVFFKRARKVRVFPVFASLALLVQSVFFITSIAIFIAITLPYERPEDSPAVVQGVRKMLKKQGFLEALPETSSPPPTTNGKDAGTGTTQVDVNAPDAGKIQIEVEDSHDKKTGAHETEAVP